MQKTPIFIIHHYIVQKTPIYFHIFMLNSVCYVQQNLFCLVIFTDYGLLSINKGNVIQHTLVASLACPIHPWICLQPFIHSYHLRAWTLVVYCLFRNNEPDVCIPFLPVTSKPSVWGLHWWISSEDISHCWQLYSQRHYGAFSCALWNRKLTDVLQSSIIY